MIIKKDGNIILNTNEAITIINNLLKTASDRECNDVEIDAISEKALQMAIQSLEQEPCDDCVKRQAVKEWLDKWDGYIDEDIIARMQYRVIDIPNAPQEPKTGHWIKAQPRGCWCYSGAYAECDCCHEPTCGGWNMKYCPNCGAKMESEVKQ